MKSKRIIMSLVGVIITAISIGAFKYAAFGVDPFQSFMSGIDTLIPIDFGTLYVVVNAILLLFALVFDRHYIGIVLLELSRENRIFINSPLCFYAKKAPV